MSLQAEAMSFSSTWADVTSVSQSAQGKACQAQSECFLKAKALFQPTISAPLSLFLY